MRPAPPLAALLAVLLTACDPGTTEVDVTRAFVRRTAATVDTFRVWRADTLALTAQVGLVRGRAAWALRDPTGAVAWEGAAADDTLTVWTTTAPPPGDWRLELRPDSAVGTFEVQGRAW